MTTAGILATPEVTAPSNYALFRALDGRAYEVRSLAALRVACVDMSVLVFDVSRIVNRCHQLSQVSDQAIAQAATVTGLSAQQTLGGLCVLLGGAMQQLRISSWADIRPRRLGAYLVRFEDGRTTAIESPARLEEYGAGLLDEAERRLSRMTTSSTERLELPDVEPIDVPGLDSMANPVLVAATPLILGVVRIIAGVAVAVLIVRAAQQLLFPEAAGRARAHDAALEALEEAYRASTEACDDLPPEEQQACRQRALMVLLNGLERANEAAGESPIDKIVRIVALGIGGAVALSVLGSRIGRRRR